MRPVYIENFSFFFFQKSFHLLDGRFVFARHFWHVILKNRKFSIFVDFCNFEGPPLSEKCRHRPLFYTLCTTCIPGTKHAICMKKWGVVMTTFCHFGILTKCGPTENNFQKFSIFINFCNLHDPLARKMLASAWVFTCIICVFLRQNP